MRKEFLYWDEPDNLSGSKRNELIGKVLAKHRSVAPTKCSRNGVHKYGESCNKNNLCSYPKCLKIA